MQLRGQVVEEDSHPGPDAGAVAKVVAVEDQGHLVRQHAQLLEEAGEQRFGRPLARLKRWKGVGADPGNDSVQGGDQVGPGGGRILVGLVEGDPHLTGMSPARPVVAYTPRGIIRF